MPASAHLQQTVRSNYLIRGALNTKQQAKVLDSAFAAMAEDEEHILSGISPSAQLPYVCTNRGLYFGQMRKEGLFKKVPTHVFVSRGRVDRAQLVQMPGYSFTSLRCYDAQGTQVVGLSFDELSGTDLSGEAQARIVAEALGIRLT